MNLEEELYNKFPSLSKQKYRFHVLSLPHTVTTKEYCACAYTMKVLKFCTMMKKRGHYIIHYGHEDSVVDCDEHVTLITNDDMNNFAIIISIENHNMHLLENTLKSIEIQKIQNLNIFLQNSNQEEKIRNLIDEKVRKYNLKLFKTKLKDHFEYIVFVSSGDQFIESSFFDIQNAIKKKPNAEIIYFDEGEDRIEPKRVLNRPRIFGGHFS